MGLSLWVTCSVYRAMAIDTMYRGVSNFGRNALDMAGKVTFSVKMMSLGLTDRELFVDAAQAGGLYGRDDGFIYSLRQYLEIKGSRLKKGTANSYFFTKVRYQGTRWSHLFLVCRKKEPTGWATAAEYDECNFVLGYIKRKDYKRALKESGRSRRHEQVLSVTPGSKRGWVGKYIQWVPFKHLTVEWWNEHVLH